METLKYLKSGKFCVYGWWVANFEEGIRLRDSGIKSKIIIKMDKFSMKLLIYNLEVVIHNCRFWIFIFQNEDKNIHLKFNTKMNRYGFDKKDLSFIVDKLKNNSNLNVKSICSHLHPNVDTTKLDVSKIELIYLIYLIN